MPGAAVGCQRQRELNHELAVGADTFTQANAAYRAKHGFPFIIAVRDYDKTGILRAFERRLANDGETEFAEACAQVERIALLRLQDMLA